VRFAAACFAEATEDLVAATFTRPPLGTAGARGLRAAGFAAAVSVVAALRVAYVPVFIIFQRCLNCHHVKVTSTGAFAAVLRVRFGFSSSSVLGLAVFFAVRLARQFHWFVAPDFFQTVVSTDCRLHDVNDHVAQIHQYPFWWFHLPC
jgi:hypothetical protein